MEANKEQIEAAAKAIYRLFIGADLHPWVEDGNSLMQCDARRYASAALENTFEHNKPLTLARMFHDTCERLAPSFGYETRLETRSFDSDSANGRLMIAVCAEIIAACPTIANQAAPQPAPAPAVAVDALQQAIECLQDVISHHEDFRSACGTRHIVDLEKYGGDSASYWDKQQRVLDRMKAQAELSLPAVRALVAKPSKAPTVGTIGHTYRPSQEVLDACAGAVIVQHLSAQPAQAPATCPCDPDGKHGLAIAAPAGTSVSRSPPVGKLFQFSPLRKWKSRLPNSGSADRGPSMIAIWQTPTPPCLLPPLWPMQSRRNSISSPIPTANTCVSQGAFAISAEGFIVEMRKNNLGPHIKALRKIAGMTQAELAAKSGMERTSITNIERGNQQLTSKTINDIADALGYRVVVKFVRK